MQEQGGGRKDNGEKCKMRNMYKQNCPDWQRQAMTDISSSVLPSLTATCCEITTCYFNLSASYGKA